jgi:hypothetical protein
MKTTKEIFMYALGGLVTLGFFVTLFFLIKQGTFEETINLVIGSLIGAFGTVVGYFYGSSKGSSDKNDLIKK